MGTIRAAAAGLSRQRDSPNRHGTSLRGTGIHVWLARYAGLTGEIIGMQTFGASAHLKELQKKFGFTTDNVVAAAKAQLHKKAKAA